MDNYSKSLARYLFGRLVEHQNDPENSKTRPRLYPSGFVFDDRDLEKWIQDHKDHEILSRSQQNQQFKQDQLG